MGTAMLTIGSVLAVHGTKYYDNDSRKHYLKVDNTSSAYAVIVFLYLFVASFAYSWGPVNILIN